MQRTAAARWACALVSNASPATLRAALPAQAWRAAAAPAWSRSMVAAQGRVNHLVRKGELEAPPHPHESQMPDKKTLINAQAAYRKQVHELKIKYRVEVEAKAELVRQEKEAQMASRKEAREAKAVKEVERKRVAAIWWERKDRIVEAARVEVAAAAYTRHLALVEKRRVMYDERFSKLCLESRAWAAEPRDVEQVIEEAILEPLPLHASYGSGGSGSYGGF